MNTTSRALLQTILTTDSALSKAERDAVQRIVEGNFEPAVMAAVSSDPRLLVTQKEVAKMLSVSRVTVWRMTRDRFLHPVEILPGVVRYPLAELSAIVQRGWQGQTFAGRAARATGA